MVYIVGFQYVEETINVCLSCRIFDFFFFWLMPILSRYLSMSCSLVDLEPTTKFNCSDVHPELLALRGGPKDVHEVLVLFPGHVFFSLEVVWSNI